MIRCGFLISVGVSLIWIMKNNDVNEAIENFASHAQTNWMVDFYRSLIQEKKDGKWDILILVTRKGFWIFKIITDCYGIGVDIKENYIYTDRYLMKTLNPAFIRGKRVCLVDDTVSRGYSLFHHYCVMKCLGARDIYPYVYAISTEFPGKLDGEEAQMQKIASEVYKAMDKQGDKDIPQLYNSFLESIRGFRYMSQDNISRLCLDETELFQKLLCPMVVNLPMLVSKPDGEVMKDEFILDGALYTRLCEGDGQWTYVNNIYSCENGKPENADQVRGYLNCDVICDYLSFNNPLVERLKSSFLQSMVIKCKYNVDSNGQYHIVFTPFAIIRSMEKEELKKVFRVLITDESEYRNKLEERMNVTGEKDFAWTAMFRAVIYILSRYVGDKFREYLHAIGISSAEYDQKIVVYNSDPEFIDEINRMDVISRCDMLIGLDLHEYQKKSINTDSNSLPAATMPDVYEAVHQMVMNDSMENNENGKSWDDCLEIDELEERLGGLFTFNSYGQFEEYVTRIILLMLEISVFGNYLKVDQEKICRGFRHGENSKLLLPERGVLCYILAEALYMMAGKKNYEKNLGDFMEKAKGNLETVGILSDNQKQHMDAFKSYSDYFIRHVHEPEFYILGKEFIFAHLNELERDIQDHAIWLVENTEDSWEEEAYGEE